MTAKTAASAAIKAANAESHAFFEKCTMCPLPLFKRTTECSESRARRSRNLGVYRRQVPPRQGLDRALPPEGLQWWRLLQWFGFRRTWDVRGLPITSGVVW